MTTLLAFYNSDGCVGRCDAKCYNAKDERCTCICGGANHGAGKSQAMLNCEALWRDWLDDYEAMKEQDARVERLVEYTVHALIPGMPDKHCVGVLNETL